MRELAVQSAPGTLVAGDRTNLQAEVTALLSQVNDVANKTTFNGVQLPSIYMWDSETDQLELVKEFGYSTFRDRLS